MKFKELKILYLYNNNISDLKVLKKAKFEKLELVDIYNNKIEKYSSKSSNNKDALNNWFKNNSNNALINNAELEYNETKQKIKEENNFMEDLKEKKFTNINMKNNNEMIVLINNNNFISNERDEERENEGENKINNKTNNKFKQSDNKKEFSIFNINNISSPYGIFHF